jgi:basic membrane protein A
MRSNLGRGVVWVWLALLAALTVPSPVRGAGGPQAIKVAFIITDPLNGSAWTQAWDTARLQLQRALDVQTTAVGPIPENNSVATEAQDLIGKGYNVIVAEDFAYQPFLHAVAQRNPNVRFILIGPNTQPHLPNVATVYGNLWQVRYAEGVLAGLMTKTNRLGFVTAHTIPSVVAGINGFALGALSVNPKAVTTVVQTGNWYDPSGATKAALTLASGGADVIAQHEDDTGALLGAASAHVWEMGSEAVTASVAPKAYLSGSYYDWGPYLISQVRAMRNGTWQATDYSGSLASGLVALGPINPAVPVAVRTRVEAVVAGLKNGSIHVFKGPISCNNGETMVAAGQILTGPAQIYPKQTCFVKGIVGKVS